MPRRHQRHRDLRQRRRSPAAPSPRRRRYSDGINAFAYEGNIVVTSTGTVAHQRRRQRRHRPVRLWRQRDGDQQHRHHRSAPFRPASRSRHSAATPPSPAATSPPRGNASYGIFAYSRSGTVNVTSTGTVRTGGQGIARRYAYARRRRATGRRISSTTRRSTTGASWRSASSRASPARADPWRRHHHQRQRHHRPAPTPPASTRSPAPGDVSITSTGTIATTGAGNSDGIFARRARPARSRSTSTMSASPAAAPTDRRHLRRRPARSRSAASSSANGFEVDRRSAARRPSTPPPPARSAAGRPHRQCRHGQQCRHVRRDRRQPVRRRHRRVQQQRHSSARSTARRCSPRSRRSTTATGRDRACATARSATRSTSSAPSSAPPAAGSASTPISPPTLADVLITGAATGSTILDVNLLEPAGLQPDGHSGRRCARPAPARPPSRSRAASRTTRSSGSTCCSTRRTTISCSSGAARPAGVRDGRAGRRWLTNFWYHSADAISAQLEAARDGLVPVGTVQASNLAGDGRFGGWVQVLAGNIEREATPDLHRRRRHDRLRHQLRAGLSGRPGRPRLSERRHDPRRQLRLRQVRGRVRRQPQQCRDGRQQSRRLRGVQSGRLLLQRDRQGRLGRRGIDAGRRPRSPSSTRPPGACAAPRATASTAATSISSRRSSLSWVNVDIDDYTVAGATVAFDDIESFRGAVGLRFGGEFRSGNGDFLAVRRHLRDRGVLGRHQRELHARADASRSPRTRRAPMASSPPASIIRPAGSRSSPAASWTSAASATA